MNNLILYGSLILCLLILINNIFFQYNILVHDNYSKSHKKFGKKNIPLSGGIFFFLIILLLNINYNFINFNYTLIIFFFLVLGLIVDLRDCIKPTIRFMLQALLIILLIYFNDFYIEKTNIFFIDLLLHNIFFSTFFTCFCILVLINGSNFLDGVNNNVTGLYILIVLSLAFIEWKNQIFIDIIPYSILLISFITFHFFNFFDKNYLGESGVYVLSVLISILVINYVNKSEFVSPILAVSLLWYPAFETLFSILRKIKSNKNPLHPDSSHLHTLILKYLKYKKFKYYNSLTGFLINFSLIINYIMAVKFFSNSKILFLTTLIYVLVYTFLYINFKKFLNKKQLIKD